MSKYKVILFDADRTLFDFDAAERNAFGIVMASFGIEYSDDDFECYKRINNKMWGLYESGSITKEELQKRRFAEFLETLDNIPSVDGDAVNRAYVEALADSSELFPGAAPMCRRLSSRYELYIVTNGVTATQKKRFYASEVKDYFKGIFVSEEAGAPKPMKAYFDHVFASIGEDKRACSVIVGDSLSNDIAGGIAAGIDAVWYAPNHDINTADIMPTATVHSFDELEAFLDR